MKELLDEEEWNEGEEGIEYDVFPASFAQQRLWFLEQLTPGSALYNVPTALRLRGPLDLQALEQAFEEIIWRHETLRTTFEAQEGQVMQVIASSFTMPFPVLSLEGLPASKQERESVRIAEEEAQTPFDLKQDLLMRVKILRLSEEDHVLLLTMHHIISDGWSVGVLIHEMVTLYEAFVQGLPSPMEDPEFQYADYAHWQREFLAGDVLDEQLTYWKKQLGGELPQLRLPVDHAYPPVQTYNGATVSFRIPAEVVTTLQTVSQQAGATLFMSMLGAYQMLLARISGQEDIAVGTPISGRNRKEIEPLIGFFVNTLVLRGDLSSDPDFATYVKNVRQTALSAFSNQEVPFERLVEELGVERDMSRTPLFQTMFVYQNAPSQDMAFSGLSITPVEFSMPRAKFELTLTLSEPGDGSLDGSFEYNTDLFDAEAIQRMIGQFQRLLAAISANPSARLSELPLLSDAEREQLLVEWNRTATDYPKNACIHHLFEAQAARTPERVAVVFQGTELTYGELNERANRLAHFLRSSGVASGSFVGLCMERSQEMIIGLLGILKAGGVYVPIDSQYPEERIRDLVEDANIQLLLTQTHLQERLPATATTTICLDTDWAQIAVHSADNLMVEHTATQLAYVTYTSGSTGKPKGVCVPHRAVVRLVQATDYAAFGADEVFLQFASISFDAATFEIWGALLNGARLVMFPPYLPSLAELARVIREAGVTTLWLTAGLFHQMVDEHLHDLSGLRQLLAGGDALSAAHVRKVLETLPHVRMINGYGPTENTTFTCCHTFTLDSLQGRTVPIGRPIANTQVFVLDRHLQPVPAGVPGELYIGGDGLAAGYLNQPELTAAAFVPHPFSADPDARLYKTGDQVAYRADGTIDFLGRVDQQVKIRGFRIELGEIEKALTAHEEVRETVVIVREDAPGAKRLVAYVVGDGTNSDAAQLRAFLKQRLPEYMIPSAFVAMEQLPLTANGKVDRRALPAPDLSAFFTQDDVAPRTPLEEQIAAIWADLLQVEGVGVFHSFFDLGGHSLLATQVISRVNEAFGVEMPLRVLFDEPTVAGLAAQIEAAQRGGQGAVQPILPVSREEDLALSFAQQRLWVVDQLLPGSAVYNIPFAVRLTGDVQTPVLERALNEILSRHESLRTTFVTVDSQPRQVFHEHVWRELPVFDLNGIAAGEQEAEVRQRVEAEAATPFDLTTGPLIRFQLLRLAEQEHVLVLNMHHIVSDGWSVGILIDELTQLYRAFAAGVASPLPELPIQYADFGHWQRHWLAGDELERQMNYWSKQLSGELPVLQLLTDKPRPPVQTHRGGKAMFQLSPELSDALRSLSQKQGTTLFMTLMAAFQTLLFRYTGQDDICVGTPIAGRNRRETEGLIGFFVNMLVMRGDLSGELTFDQLLERVRERALEAYSHQDVPFEKLVEEFQTERDMSYSPLFQAVFSLQNASADIELPGLTLGMVEFDAQVARFDLNLTMYEDETGLAGNLTYNSDLFHVDSMERMIGHFTRLLEGIARDSKTLLTALPMLSAEERQQLISGWNNTDREVSYDKCVHELFEAQAERVPDAVAVVCEDKCLTYRELNTQANRLAHYLEANGVGPDVIVGIYLERSVEVIVALVAILKAGGAYVAFDTTFPADRIAFMLEDTQVPVVLTEQSLAARLPEHVARVFCFDTDGAVLAELPAHNPVSGTTAENLVYVIFTSGSTGRPKGVMVEHRNLLNYLVGIQEVMRLEPSASYANVSTFSADVGNTAIFPALTRGGTLHVLAQERVTDANLMAEYFDRHEIDLLKIVPTHLAALMTSQPEKVLPKKGIVVGGETLRWDLIERIEAIDPDLFVVNHYGPTEVTVAGVTYRVEQAPEMRQSPTVPLGGPIANVQVYLLDRHMQPVPANVPGEVYFGGAGISRGYLGRPDLTEERYLPDPFSARAGARLYKTGDLARRLSDGRIEFLTRADQQVKIRGFRVELGEVETVLGLHPSVKENVIVAREESPGDRRLIAYVVLDPFAFTGAQELRDYMKSELPEYMVPAAFVMIDAIPLTANGKIDRRALPAPDYAVTERAEYTAPVTSFEETVAEIWAEVLGVDRVSRTDDFFDLGGHSLLATQAISRVNAALGVKVPLRVLFEAGTVEGVARHAEQLQAADAPKAISRVSRERPLPLSYAQQRMWVIDQLIPGTAVYNMPYVLRLQGQLHTDALEQAVNEIFKRHESFRTTFAKQDGQPVQVIAPHAWCALEVTDLRDVTPEEVERLVQAETETPFDLEQGPLARVRLMRTSEDEHVLTVTLHHIISDGWSRGVFTRELVTLYEAFAQGQESPLTELPIQYADYAVWQRDWLQGDVMEQQLSYWKNQLGGELPVLQLPTDRPHPPQQTHHGAVLRFALSPAASEGLKSLSQRIGATLFMILLAAYQTLLSRWSGQKDISVGTPIAGRHMQDTEALVGLFVNTLVMRTDLSDDPSFEQLLDRVRETALGAYAHQDVPFEKLVEELQPERDTSRTPLFQTMFTLVNLPLDEMELPGLTISGVEYEQRIAKFDLSLFLFDEEAGLEGLFEYNTDLFDEQTIQRMIGHFQQLAEAITSHSQTSVAELPLLSEHERDLLLNQWGDPQINAPRDVSIPHLFAEQAAAYPERIALRMGDDVMTYGELDRRSNQLARYLQQRGAGPDVLIGICVERSFEMVIGLLGILKSGAAYVPLDPNYPAERIAFMLEDAQIRLLLTQAHLRDEQSFAGVEGTLLDEQWELIAQESDDPVPITATPDHLAYVTYTSGSTGRPKGVQIPQRGVVRLVQDTNYVSFGADEVFLQFSSISFDAATFEIFGSLLNGGSLVIFPPHLPTLEELGRIIRTQGVTTIFITTALFHQLADGHTDDLQGLRQLLTGGELMSVPHMTKAVEALPNCTILHVYGPTENTTFSTFQAVTPEHLTRRSIPIGRPIAHTQAYVLDAHRQLVPVGVPGELLLGGLGLARSYLNLPEQTDEKFVPHPFVAGERLYRTGDLVRWLPDGSLEFLGRIDHQVKLRGFRIELGEIETVLQDHLAVREQIVLLREDAPGEKRLVAYASLHGEADERELRTYLKSRLPEYMVPSAVVIMDSLPLNRNGKIDRPALPKPDGVARETIAPRTATEEIVASIYADVLHLTQVGIDDHFFDLGGHSLLATQVATRLHSAFGVEVPLRLLFDAPTVEELAARIEQMVQATDGTAWRSMAGMERPDHLPLSFSQQRLWVIDQLIPGTAVYNIPLAIRMQGALHVDVLERSLNEIVTRHEALRTTFAQKDDQPYQIVHAQEWRALLVRDLSGFPATEREAEALRLAEAEAVTPFDLVQGPLLRYSLLRLSDEDHVLLVNMHHIVSDGWSLGVFIAEITALYQAFMEGQPSPLAPLTVQYPDYALWQRERLAGEHLDKQLSYWLQQLGGELTPLPLPVDRPRPSVQTYEGATRLFVLDAELLDALHTLSRREGVTLFMTLMSAFQTLLFRYSGQEDVVVGTPVAGRTGRETEELIGFFVNTLVMRTDLSGAPTFHELLQRVRDVALDAYAHQDVPFERLVEVLQPERDPSRSPLFQVMFALNNTDATLGEETGWPGLTLTPLNVDKHMSPFDLQLHCSEGPDGLHGFFQYNTQLFDEATIERMIAHFRQLIQGIAADPAQPIHALPLLTAAEWEQQAAWNDTAVDYQTDLCLHQLFEQQAATTPDATALVFEHMKLTYRELDERANQLAHKLQALGVQPDQLVGVCMERSIEMVVALYGILKAGGAYVPLDPTAPAERLQYMLTDSQTTVLLIQQHLADQLASQAVSLLVLDADGVLDGLPVTAPDTDVSNAHAAYMIYTSGSTGQPKGVINEHSGIVNRLLWMQDEYRLTSADRVLQKTPYFFDVSVWEFFWPLLTGATLVIARAEGHKDAGYLVDLIKREEITTLHFVPSMLGIFLEEESVHTCTSIHQVMASGEALPYDLQERFYEKLGGQAKLHNLYGPTEAAIDVTYWECQPGSQLGYVPIGRPVANTQMYVLDARLQPLPVGVAGELHITGVQVARGYHNRADLTAEKFIANPFGTGRMYKTGDLARWLPDGTLQYLGRIDFQVKIRGFRIELGEIEAQLLDLPEIKAVSVQVREDGRGDQRLVAYVVADQSASVSEWRDALLKRLPDYMVPSAFVRLDALPLTSNGKVDRRALPDPDDTAAVRAEYVAPQTMTEAKVAEVWAELLGVARIGRSDNFFHLGGHSLLATQAISRMNAALGVKVPLRVFFEAGTVEAVARQVQLLQGTELASIQQVSREMPLLLSYAQQRMWVIDQLFPGQSVYNMPHVLRLQGELNTQALTRAVNEIFSRHESLRTTFTAVDGEPVQVIAPHEWRELEVVDLRTASQADVQRLIQAETQMPFDLEQGPLARVRLMRTAEDEHVLTVTLHHIIFDGWSQTVFSRELVTLYEAFAQGADSPLQDLPIQYADYAVWQREWLQGDVMEQQMSYWRQQLGGELPVLDLPTDRPHPPQQSNRGAVLRFALSQATKDRLQALSQRKGTTLFMTLLAAYQTLLSRWSGQEDITVGTPIAGRHIQETESLLGLFVNTLVMRTDLSGDPTFEQVLDRVRETALGAYAHQDVPFEKLVEELQPERNASRTPLFQTMFTLVNQQQDDTELPGLKVEGMEYEQQNSKFDLSLFLSEEAGGLNGLFEYSTDLFDEQTIERMTLHFIRLAESIADQPQTRVAALTILSEAEQDLLLNNWADPQLNAPQDVTIPALFAEQAAAHPQRAALRLGQAEMSYAELDRRSNQLARHLQQKGVGPDVLVGLSAERSFELIVGLLGILKAGGAYVPIDPNYPGDRIAFMLEDANIGLLLTQAHLQDRLPSDSSERVLLDAQWEEIAQESDTALPIAITPDHLAYVIYTSGSTGRPKGVQIPHRGVVHLVKETNYAALNAEQVFLQFSSISFDAATFEIFGSLLNGGSLVIFPPHLPNLAELGRVIRTEGVTTALLTTALFHQMADTHLEDLQTLRQLLVGGELVSLPHMKKAFESLPECTLIHAYGPTENSVISTFRVVTQDDLSGRSIPIGQPVAHTQAYVLDRHRQPVPVGVPGELHVGGLGLARSYLNLPEQTERAFIPHPFAAGERLYRTGDLVRWLPNGSLEFLGRIDHQVKLRGFRIELGEIESALLEHPDVREQTVLLREDVPGEKRLVAYVSAEGTVDERELKTYLKSRLPEYMVPSAIVLMESLPINRNGKIDRQALPLPEHDARETVALRTATEEIVAGIYADVLHLTRVGAADHFFDLGGHSLLATQVASRLQDAFGVEVPLRLLFDAPTVEELAARIDLMTQDAGGMIGAPIVPVERKGLLPLSFSQQRLWVIDQLIPNAAVYNVPLSIRMQGELRVDVLERSLNEILARHEALRTTFAEADGEPCQIVHAPEWKELPVHDVSGLPEAEREAAARSLVQAEALTPFDLVQGALIRFGILRLAEQEHVLCVNMHHIVSDGWSLGVFIREISALYAAFVEGQPSPLTPLSVQYPDYALWQRERLAGEVLDKQLAYWVKQLGGELAPLQLPADRPRPPVQTYDGASKSFLISMELLESLRTLSRREGVTMYMTLLSAFQALLHRYSGQDDIAVGTSMAGRTRRETEALIGFFVNTLVMRTDLSGVETFRELLQQVRGVTLDAYAHQDMPFERIVEALQPVRDPSRSPLFQVLFVLQNNSIDEAAEWKGLTLTPLEVDKPLTQFDLELHCSEEADGLRGTFQYNTNLFDGETIDRMTEHFGNLLQGIAEDASQAIHALPLLTASEQQQQAEWNDTAVDYQTDLCLHQLFEQQAAATPDAVAVRFEEIEWTYRQLNERANQLAHRLQTLGVQPDQLVGVCMERSLELVVALYGILKAGAAYVPLDPTAPADRLHYMLEDCGTAVLLTQQHLLGRLDGQAPQLVVLDERGVLDGEPITNPVSGVIQTHAAYMIYTSGSTGKPKGVINEHRGIINRLLWMQDEYRLTSADRVLQKTPYFFDVSVWEFFWPLITGATLVVARPEGHKDPGYLADVIEREQITTLHFVPSMLHVFLEEANVATLSALRQVMASGEALPYELQERFYKRLGGQAKLHNLYGPTEAAVDVTYWACEPDSGLGFVPIGRPVANTQIYVLDAHLQPVPVGVAGELHIAGVQVARGYHNRPELTAEKFIANPFGEGRMYKTGDLARRLPDGSIQYLGRIDFQVKIRGFRIELGEIEANLLELPGVLAVSVQAREDGHGDNRLVAYLVADENATSNDWRDALLQRLPDYMVPSVFIRLDEIPLTANGKIDARALPAPDASYDSGEAYAEPRDETERKLAELFARILGIHSVGIHDSFFARGGHSLSAMRLRAEIAREFGIQLPLLSLFQAATVAELSRVLHQQGLSVNRSSLVPLRTGAERTPLFLVHAIGGTVHDYLELTDLLGEQPVYGLQAPGLDDDRTAYASVEAMAAAYITEMRTVQPQGPYLLGGWSFGGTVAYEIAQQLEAAGERVEMLALLDSYVPDTSRAELLTEQDLLLGYVGDLAGRNLFDVREVAAGQALLEDAENFEALLGHADVQAMFGGLLAHDEMARGFAVYKTHRHAQQAYVAGTSARSVTLFRAADARTGRQHGWEQLTPAVSTVEIPGDHFSLLQQPNVIKLAEHLREQLFAAHQRIDRTTR